MEADDCPPEPSDAASPASDPPPGKPRDPPVTTTIRVLGPAAAIPSIGTPPANQRKPPTVRLFPYRPQAPRTSREQSPVIHPGAGGGTATAAGGYPRVRDGALSFVVSSSNLGDWGWVMSPVAIDLLSETRLNLVGSVLSPTPGRSG